MKTTYHDTQHDGALVVVSEQKKLRFTIVLTNHSVLLSMEEVESLSGALSEWIRENYYD